MLNTIKNKTNKVNQSRFMKQTAILGSSFWNVALIIVPMALCSYILISNDDRVVIVVGIGIGVYGLMNLATTAHRAARLSALVAAKAAASQK